MRGGRRGRIGSGIAACLLAAVVLTAWPAAAGEKWGPFRGRIVDVETGQGIAGAVLLVHWVKVFPTVAGTVSEFFDVREAVSNLDGYVEIPRRDPPLFSLNIRLSGFRVFAPGYDVVGWKVASQDGEVLIEQTAFEMRQLNTRRDLLNKSRSRPSIIPVDRIPKYIQAVNVEREMLGLDPIGQ